VGCELVAQPFSSRHSTGASLRSVGDRSLWEKARLRALVFCETFSSIVKLEMNQQLEQWINIKFLLELGKNDPGIHQILQRFMASMP